MGWISNSLSTLHSLAPYTFLTGGLKNSSKSNRTIKNKNKNLTPEISTENNTNVYQFKPGISEAALLLAISVGRSVNIYYKIIKKH